MGLAAGKLNRKITLQRFTTSTDDDSGEQVKVWATLGPDRLSASQRRATASESRALSGITASISDVFEIRWSSTWADLSALDRLLYEGRTQEIVGVEEIGRRVGLRIFTVAKANR